MDKISSKQIFEKIIDMEEAYQLFSYEIDGVKIWELLRWELIRKLITESGIQGQAHNVFSKNVPVLTRIKRYVTFIYNAFSKNPLMGNYTKETLIFENPRKVLVNGLYVDLYTNFLIESMQSTNYEVLERNYLGRHMGTSGENEKYLDIFTLYERFSRILNKGRYKKVLKNNDFSLLEQVEVEIEQLFSLKIDLKNVAVNKLVSFQIYYKMYNKLFQKRKPKKIYLLASYTHIPLIAAAKANKIKVNELQHGVISPYNPAYSYPKEKKGITYFPDFLYVFGEYWKWCAHFPISTEHIKVLGYPYFNERRLEYKDVKKRKKQILVLSQGTIGELLSSYTYFLAQKLDDYHFIYKLHPGEYGRWRNSYKDLEMASRLPNVTVVENSSKHPLYLLLAESEFQIGVSSSAIYEGLAFGCKTILVDLPSIEHMEYLINKRLVMKASTPQELVDMVKIYKVEPFETDYFFAETNRELIKSEMI